MNIKFECVTKKVYHKTILSRCSFMIETTGIVGLLGPNSLETTTILRLIAGTMQPNNGKIVLNHTPLHYSHRQEIAYLEHLRMFPSDSNIATVLFMYQQLFSDFDHQKCQILCEQLMIDLQWPLSSLTRGMEASVLIALTLSRKAKLYLLNEPFAGIDFVSRERIVRILQTYRQQDATVIISTNHIELADQIFEHVIFFDGGRMYREYNLTQWQSKGDTTIIDKYREVYE